MSEEAHYLEEEGPDPELDPAPPGLYYRRDDSAVPDYDDPINGP